MSNISLEGNASGTGTFTIAAPNTSSNFTLTLPQASGTLILSQAAGGVATNTALGTDALAANTTGANNTAVGYQALDANQTGVDNTAVGYNALGANTTNYNNAFGYETMFSTTTGTRNNAMGRQALYTNTTGNDNVALGHAAMRQNTTGSSNTAVGYEALYANTTGTDNTAVGHSAGATMTTGRYNTLVGQFAGNALTSSSNTCLGAGAGYLITTGAKNTIIGTFSGNQGGLDIRTTSNNIVLSDGDGNPKIYWSDNSARSAGTWITTNVTPVTAASVGANPGTAAIWDGSGNLYKQSSSVRYKENIAEWTVTDAQLNAFVNLNPKLWDYIGKENGCAGFIAEDIESLGLKNAYNTSPLLNYSNEGEPESNRDFALIALQHKVIQRLDSAVKELSAKVTALEAQLATPPAEPNA